MLKLLMAPVVHGVLIAIFGQRFTDLLKTDIQSTFERLWLIAGANDKHACFDVFRNCLLKFLFTILDLAIEVNQQYNMRCREIAQREQVLFAKRA